MKLIIGEDKPAQGAGTLGGWGMMNKGEIDKYAKELNDRVYEQDIIGIRGLDALHNISMTSQDMQLMEHMNMGLDDVARYFGTPTRCSCSTLTRTIPPTPTPRWNTCSAPLQPDVTEMEQEMNRKLLRREDFGRRRIHMCEPLLTRQGRHRRRWTNCNFRRVPQRSTRFVRNTTVQRWKVATSSTSRPTSPNLEARN